MQETLGLLRGALSEVNLQTLLTTPPPAELVVGGLGFGGGDLASAVEQLKNREQVAALRRFMNTVAPSVVENSPAAHGNVFTSF